MLGTLFSLLTLSSNVYTALQNSSSRRSLILVVAALAENAQPYNEGLRLRGDAITAVEYSVPRAPSRLEQRRHPLDRPS